MQLLLVRMGIVAAFYLTTCIAPAHAQQGGRRDVILSLDPPSKDGKSVTQQIQYSINQDFEGSILIQAFQQVKDDSIRLYDIRFDGQTLKKGIGSLVLSLDKNSRGIYQDKSFLDALQRLGTLPPGQYRAYLTLHSDDSSLVATKDFRWSADSAVVLQSPLRWQANALLASGSIPYKHRPNAGTTLSKPLPTAASKRATNRLQRGLRKEGVSVQTQILQGKSYSAFYYEKWFLGRYEMTTENGLQERIASEKDRLQSNAASLVSNNLEDFRSVSAQMRELNQAKKKAKGKGLEGVLELSNYASTGQEPNSEQDNNYVELAGQVSTEVMDMPIGLEGYYTTQDLGRQAKASYIRVRYDAEKAKSELLRLVTDYKRKYSETVAKGKGLEQVYGSYLSSLEGQQSSLLSGFTKDYCVDPIALTRYGGDVERMLAGAPGGLDTSGISNKVAGEGGLVVGDDSTAAAARQKYADTKAKLLQNKAEIQKRYDQLIALRRKTEKYQALLSQYSDGVYLDSAIHGTKLQALAVNQDASYKDMAKAASGLLPEGAAKRFASGLTNLEAGILNKYESSYTWAGQTAKGGSIGYDVGFAQLSATIGKTEYVSRSGSVDRYSAYSGRADFEPLEGQKLSFIYYGYSPSRNMLNDARFNRRAVDVALPTFTAPVHILSLLTEGTVAKSLSYALEGAVSRSKGESVATGRLLVIMANSAIKSALEWAIPKTTASLKGEWEHMGRDFQNSALPIMRAGTERYTIGSTIDLLKGFLHLGVQYNTLRQESFTSTGYSQRWGFDVRTRSKRYPNVALSYKPFATFRAYDDTLTNLEQRPLIGEVWTGRSRYQIKRPGGIVHRFSVLYNQNSTTSSDSFSYRSTTAQAAYLYTVAGNAVNINGGWMVTPQLSLDHLSSGPLLGELRSCFLASSYSRLIGKRASANIGGDGAVAHFGLQRLALTLGGAYTLAKRPLTLRLQTRLTSFRTDATADRSTIGAAILGIGWRFQTGNLAGKGDSSI